MPELLVAREDEFVDGECKIVTDQRRQIGVFSWEGQYFAYDNRCLHQGGPACEGVVMHHVEDVVDENKRFTGQRFTDQVNFVCPWHGYEYDLRTGACVSDRRLKLRSYQVLAREGHVYVVL